MLNKRLNDFNGPLELSSGIRKKLLDACKSYKLRKLGQRLTIRQRRTLRGICQSIALKNVPSPKIEFAGFEESPSGNSSPLVSIIIPVYNNLPYLKDCLESALKQTSNVCEVIALDDASPDTNVMPLLAGLKAKYPSLVLAQNETNLGISGTQNKLIDMARGKFVAFLDCDDILDSDCIKTLVPMLDDNLVYLHTGTRLLQNETNATHLQMSDTLPRRDYFVENRHMFFATHLKIIRKAALLRIGGFRKKYDAAQDLDVALKIAFYYDSSWFKYCNEALYTHRLHALQTTQKSTQKQDDATSLIENEADNRYFVNRNKQTSRFVKCVQLSQALLKDERSLEQTIRAQYQDSIQAGFVALSLSFESNAYLDGYEEETIAIFANEKQLQIIVPRNIGGTKDWFEIPVLEGFTTLQKTFILRLDDSKELVDQTMNLIQMLFLGKPLTSQQAQQTLYVPAIQLKKI
jgi:glycosyltransferase involved in cell wall biosynthesis